MEHLLDDVLLMVMQYLSVPDLLACRLVCKRIGGLALHPHLWRHRRRVTNLVRHCLPVLRLAPCLASLHLVLPAKGQRLYSTTRCVVSSLELSVHNGSDAALVVRNQEVLGRLKSIAVTLYTKGSVADGPALLWAIAFTAGLEKLAVNVIYPHYFIPTPSLPTARPRPSLRTFTCCLIPELGPFRDFVLATHADTMEEVRFDGDEYDSKALTSTASLLAGMPNLRRLYCPLLPGLGSVAACESLERVELDVRPGMREAVQQAKEFLCGAKQLRNVTIKYRDGAYGAGVGVDLVLALVSSGSSLVESLTISIHGFSTDKPLPQLQPVIRALSLLPVLQVLELPMMSEELLLAITPATNPVLRTIKLYPSRFNAPLCAHGYLHWDSVEKLQSRCPSLDLKVHASYYCAEGDPHACQPCALGCHGEVWENEWREEYEDMITRSDDDDSYPDFQWITIPRFNLNPVPSDSTPLP